MVFFLSSEIEINSAGCNMDFHCATPGAVCSNSICVCSPEYYFFDGQTCVESEYSKTCVKGPLKNKQNKDLNDK